MAEESNCEDGKMNSCKTILNLTNAIMGCGVLAVPYAFSLANYSAVPLLFLVLGFTTFSAVVIGDALKIVRMQATARYETTTASCRDFTFLAEISGGRWGKGIVGAITLMEVWVSCVTRLVLAGDNIRAWVYMERSQAVIACLLMCSFMMFIPLRLYAYISFASLIALMMASSCYVGELFIIPTSDWSLPGMEWTPDLGELFRAYGLFMFCFSGHPCLPAFHESMQSTQRWTACVSWTFCLAILFYLAVGLLSFLVKGDASPIFTEDMSISLLKDISVALFTVKIQTGTPLMLRVVLSSLQIWPSGTTKQVFRNALPIGLVLSLTGAAACLLADQLAALASLTGALVMNFTCLIIPCLMYMKLSLQWLPWSQQPCGTKAKWIACGVSVLCGSITAVGTTYFFHSQ